MNNDERKPRLHIHFGGLIIIIIIILILFKVDLKSKIQSPQFQKNINYIEELFINLWHKYIPDNLTNKSSTLLKDLFNKSLEKNTTIDINLEKVLNTDNVKNNLGGIMGEKNSKLE